MKLKTSLMLVAAVVAATVFTLALGTWVGMRTLGDLQDKGFDAAELGSQARDMSNAGARLYQVIADAVINQNLDDSAALWAKTKKATFDQLEGMERNLDSAERKSLVQGARADVETLASLFEGKTMPMLHAKPVNMDAVREIDGQMDAVVSGVRDKLDKLAVLLSQDAIAHDQHFTSVYMTMLSVLGVAGAVALAVVGVLQWRNYRQIFGRLGGEPDYAAQVTNEIAAGNLANEIIVDPAYPGSLLHAMQSMRASLREIVTQLQNSAGVVNNSARQLSDASTQVSAGTSAQSSAASNMAAAVEQLTVSINHVSDNTKEVMREAEQAGARSVEGEQIARQAVTEMERVATAVGASAGQMHELGDESRNIANVVNVIREVAEQTNLLALNAAIEAARAGEQGRGFAVVADEVRKLAERTGNSTSEIATMVERILGGTESAVQGVQAGSEQVARGVSLVTQAGDEMSRIRAGASQLLGSVNEIAVALNEQSAASNLIARDIERVAQMAEESNNAAAAVADAVGDLRDQATEVTRIAGRFRL
ncbi:methyl-accepting chemotaxis protein [Uliginosibacterium sp. H3]|uniref:Methyl-accepting chemotaxis protein n=1 Tax=Uliginosibacterium silvisoli TaxID=3114758 RepID=A0ABU6K0L2_9RHOO|nr:methyl-accepting chemotaxis protein [Uliginosibacterium sp. H3]